IQQHFTDTNGYTTPVFGLCGSVASPAGPWVTTSGVTQAGYTGPRSRRPGLPGLRDYGARDTLYSGRPLACVRRGGRPPQPFRRTRLVALAGRIRHHALSLRARG